MDEIQILRIPANIESDKDSLNQQQTDTLIKQTEYLEDGLRSSYKLFVWLENVLICV